MWNDPEGIRPGPVLHVLQSAEIPPFFRSMPLEFCKQRVRLRGLGLTAVVAVLASGCSTTSYKVEVDAINNPELPTGTAYILAPKDPAKPNHDLHYEEVAERVRLALGAKGMYEAADPTLADVIVEFDYGERGLHQETRTVNRTQIVQPSVTGIPIDPTTGRPYPAGTYPPGTYPSGAGGYPSGTYPYPSNRSQVVSVPETESIMVSEKYVNVSARENPRARDRKKTAPKDVWQVEAVVEDQKSSVYTCMPALVGALSDYIGTSTGGKQVVNVNVQK
jgi:hypothetical protein